MTNICLTLVIMYLPTHFAQANDVKSELIMIEEDGCSYCLLWKEEIGVGYPKSSEGKIAPLRMVNIAGPRPSGLNEDKPLHYTPTFILMIDGKEVDRLLGYPGDQFFYPMLRVMMWRAGLINDPSEAATRKYHP